MIEELNRFVLVAKNGNLTKTAHEIFITQSALSQSIARLEKTLGTKLMEQKGRYLQLTADGIAVKTLAEKILILWQNAKNPEVRQSPERTYSIGAYDNAALRLGSYIQKVLNSNLINLELVIDTSGRILEQLRLGVLDIVICVIDKKSTSPKNVLLVKTFTESLIPVSSIPFSRPYEEIPFILYSKGSNTREQTDLIFTKIGIKPKVIVESTSPTFMKELAILGSGVALLPENFIRSDIKQGVLKKQTLPVKFKREYGIYIQRNGQVDKDNPLIREIIKTLSKK